MNLPIDVSFRYSQADIEAILKTIPEFVGYEERCYILGSMEELACVYKFLVDMDTPAGQRRRATLQELNKSLKTTIANLSAVHDAWGSRWFEKVMRDLTQLLEANQLFLEGHQLPPSLRKSRKEKAPRRMVVARALSLWIALREPVERPKKFSTEMVDFILATVNPILGPHERFHDDSHGRDKLGAVLKAVRDKGEKLVHFATMIEEEHRRGNSEPK
jgi:hypothetical protein